VQLEFKRSNNTEIAATSASRPVEIRVFLSTGVPELAIRRNDIYTGDVIQRQAKAPRKAPKTAAQRQSTAAANA
jgi:hypothetical protein